MQKFTHTKWFLEKSTKLGEQTVMLRQALDNKNRARSDSQEDRKIRRLDEARVKKVEDLNGQVSGWVESGGAAILHRLLDDLDSAMGEAKHMLQLQDSDLESSSNTDAAVSDENPDPPGDDDEGKATKDAEQSTAVQELQEQLRQMRLELKHSTTRELQSEYKGKVSAREAKDEAKRQLTGSTGIRDDLLHHLPRRAHLASPGRFWIYQRQQYIVHRQQSRHRAAVQPVVARNVGDVDDRPAIR